MSCSLLIAGSIAALAAPSADRDTVAQLDRTYQIAVKRNDVQTMKRILHPRFQLVLGDGTKLGREALLDEARRRTIVYELQDEERGSQTVRVCGDTAIVTAKLLLKGVRSGERFERSLWFSDTYVRTASGWKYLFGQASLPLTPEQSARRPEAISSGSKLAGDIRASDQNSQSDARSSGRQ